MKKTLTLIILAAATCTAQISLNAGEILVEAESFGTKGGWVVDQQFMDFMGSPYLLAHGMGVPVQDASTEIDIPEPGKWQVYVRTYNWTSPWTDAEGPGKFKVGIGGRTLKNTLGASGNGWKRSACVRARHAATSAAGMKRERKC